MDKRLLVVVAALLAMSVDASDAQRLNAPSAISSQELLPASTKAWVSIPDAKRLDDKFLQTQLGQLSQDEMLQPFIDGLKAQFQDWVSEKNVRLGLKLEDVQGVRSGEICIAGIMPNHTPQIDNKAIGRDSHGLVLLVDVSENLEQATDLMEKVSEDLVERGASKEKYGDSQGQINGAKVSKWKFPKKSRLQDHRHAYHAITNGWLLSCDNETIFREVVRRLVNIDNVKKGETLAAQKAFQNVMKNVASESVEAEPEVLWYINPFGYIQLARAIAREEQEFNQTNSDDWARILQKIGFDGFKGVGGTIAFATGSHEMLNRTFVYKPADNAQDIKQKRVFDMFDFTNRKKTELAPPTFLPDSVSGYFCGAWDMQKALQNVGHAIDTFAKKAGTLDDTLEALRVEMKVDVPDVIAKFDNEMMIISDSKMPISDDSERLVIAIRLNGSAEYVMDNIAKSWPHQHEITEHNGFKIIEIDDSIGNDELDVEVDDPFRDPADDWGDEELEEEEEPAFSLFERRFCAATKDYLFISNNNEYLKQLLEGICDAPLNQSADYQRVAASIDQLTDKQRISFRQFGRLDRTIRPNYEMMRAGKMAASSTILARLLNHAFESRSKSPDATRKQKIDGSTLPSDFDKHVAPYFGPAGWVMETTDDGWLFTSVLLVRQEAENHVVKKEDATSRRE